MEHVFKTAERGTLQPPRKQEGDRSDDDPSACGHESVTLWWFLKKLNIEVAYGPAISLLDIYPKEAEAGAQICVHPCS